ncbi:VOC family protein [Tateyamaria sp. ANG-S1]|uniref:VOC family protein n=1 Tax=Tateyamaria sp. ANG-S1 TaxID=1577905 RepID=UPI00057DC6A1|nr:VOC family protein [Tateyamaria sp. ANG-S1]KIC48405.1 extradiol dioxygenase [Tateyamaria sp. ANG-S1]
MTTHLGSLSLIVPDYDSAIAFYCEQMGFRLVADIDQGHKRWVEVQPPAGGPTFVLARADTPEQQAAIGNQGAGRVWLFLHSDDFARDHAQLSAQPGITFEEEPRHEPYGTVAVFRDLFGNRWDLIQKT